MSTKRSKAAPSSEAAKPYEQTPEERAAVEAMAARIKDLPVAPRVKVSEKGGVAQLSPDHPDFAVGHIPGAARRSLGIRQIAEVGR